MRASFLLSVAIGAPSALGNVLLAGTESRFRTVRDVMQEDRARV